MIHKLKDNPEQILNARYYLNVNEDWPGLCTRVTENIVPVSCKLYDYTEEEVDKLERECFEMINNLYFLPNSPTMFNAGTEYPMLSACFVIDVEDDLASIYESVKEAALIHKMGGGVGFSLSKLRSNGSKIATTHGHSGGAVSFLQVFSYGTGPITAAGKRKGANMAMLDIGHADAPEFISCKSKEGELENFNISVRLTDEFMDAVKNNKEFSLKDPKDGRVVETVNAVDLMDKIVYSAWSNGEPGICFIDTVNRENPTPHLGKIHSSNPCGEFYSIPYNSCNLGSINLSRYVENKVFNWDLFHTHIRTATTYLDCIIDANKYPLAKIDKVTKETRPIGLGVMGLADTLIKMGIKYNSEEGFEFAQDLAEHLSYYSLEESTRLAQRRGKYPAYMVENHKYEKASKHGKLDWTALFKKIKRNGLRHSHTTVIAPSGTIARIANESSFGIEPLFAIDFKSNILDGKSVVTKNGLYEDFLNGKLDVNEDVFVVSGKIPWKDHIEMQHRWQLFVHNGISKTINMPEGTKLEEVADAYMYAYDKGLKGITLYIAGSRENEVLVSDERTKKSKAGRKPKDINTSVLAKLIEEGKTANELSDLFDCSISTIKRRVKELNMTAELLPDKIKRPDEIDSKSYKIQTPSGKVFISIGVDEETGQPIETVVNISTSGSYDNAMAEALGKMVSKALQHRMDPYEVIDTINDIVGGDTVGWWRGKSVKSVPDALAKALKAYMEKYVEPAKKVKKSVAAVSGKHCPECGEFLSPIEGCWKCLNCNWSRCG